MKVNVEIVDSSRMRKRFQTWVRYLVANGCDLVLPLTVFVSGIVFQNIASLVPWLVERFYSSTIYPNVLGALSFLSRSFSFSIGEVLTCLFISVCCGCFQIFCIGDRKSTRLNSSHTDIS